MPPILTGSASSSCSACVQLWSVMDGFRASAIAHSRGASRSSVSGRVPKKYVQRYFNLKVRQSKFSNFETCPTRSSFYRWRSAWGRTWSQWLHPDASFLLWRCWLLFLQKCSWQSLPYKASAAFSSIGIVPYLFRPLSAHPTTPWHSVAVHTLSHHLQTSILWLDSLPVHDR